MTIFKDSTGREWTIAITLGTARRVLDALGVDLLNPAALSDGVPLSQRLLYDDLFLSNVVAAIVSPQLTASGVDADAFADALGGAELAAIETAFWTEYKNFFAARGKVWAARAIETDRETKRANEARALENVTTVSNGEQSIEQQDAQESAPTSIV